MYVGGETMLNERQQKLIKLLQEKDTWMRGKNLAALLNVSDRTIRSDIEKVNNECPGSILSSSQHGYHYGKESNQIKEEQVLPQNNDERVSYIMQKLLFERREISIDSLLRYLCISEFTLINDLKRLKVELKSYPNLKLVRTKKFLSLVGLEEEKRSLYKQMLDKETKGNFLNLNTLASLFHDFDLLKVKTILDDVLNSYEFTISEVVIPMLMMHIGVALERIRQRNYVFLEYETSDIVSSQEYQIAVDFYNRIEKEMQIIVVEEEIIQLSLLLLGKKSLTLKQKHDVEDGVDETLISMILEELKRNFDIDFTKDDELLVGLTIHIRSLMSRAKNQLRPYNVFLAEIKRKYPLVFDMGVQVCSVLEKEKQIKVDENEIGFIALHLGAAYERNHSENKFQVVLIVPHEEAFSQTCKRRIMAKFSERLTIIACFSMIDEQKILSLHPDFLITTSDISHTMNLTTIQISILCNLEDESTIFQTLNRLEKQRYHQLIRNEIQTFLNPNYFYCDMDFSTPEEVIHFMCEHLKRDGQVEPTFEASVLERERISATSFYYAFSTPHALRPVAKHSNISVMILKKPIPWGEFQVRLVLMLALQNEDKKLLKLIFGWLSQTINEVDSFASMLESKNYDEFIKRFIDFDYIK